MILRNLQSAEEQKNQANSTSQVQYMSEDEEGDDLSYQDDLDDEDYGDEQDIKYFIENDDQGRIRVQRAPDSPFRPDDDQRDVDEGELMLEGLEQQFAANETNMDIESEKKGGDEKDGSKMDIDTTELN